LRGEQQVAMRRTVTRPRTPPRSRTSPGGNLSEADGALLERLKAWRLAEARAQSVPAFVILHDRTLAEIARQRPHDLPAMGSIGGIGAKKLARYGPALVELIAGAIA
jgi:ATP-dependent DNA helicase RecQ